MVKFRRNKLQGGTYFFTVTLRDRKSKMLITHINELRYAIKQVKIKYPFKMIAIVILPDHIHAIWELPKGDNDYSKRWQRIKGIFTHKLIKKGINLKKDERGEYDLWQRRFWEHTIRDEIDLEQHVNYIHYNPIKHQFVKNLNDWPFSSFHQYVKNKLLPPNWSSSDENDDSEFGE